MRIIYVLPKEAYFAPGLCGRVSHAVGLADTLAKSGKDVTVLSGPKAAENIRYAKTIEVEQGNARSWHGAMFAALDKLLADNTENTAVIVRYGVSNAFRFVSRMRKRQTSVIWCFEVNSLAFHQNPDLPGPLKRLVLAVETRIVEQADYSYLVSDELRKDIEPRVRAGHRCLVVPNGGPPAITLPSAQSDKAFRFVFFGMLQSYNHLDIMIEGFLSARAQGLEAELHVHGDGPLLEKVEAMAKTDIAIHAHGRYELQSLLANELNESQCVLLLPFGDSVGLNRVQSPIKQFEYMSTGLPIIASDMPQIRLSLTHNKTAILVNPRSAEEWGQAMLDLKYSDERRRQMSNEIRQSYPSYTWNRRTVQLFEGLSQHFNC